MAKELMTERLTLRQWSVDDAEQALAVYGDAAVSHWLSPAMDTVPDVSARRLVLQQWTAEDERLPSPTGRWAIELRSEKRVVGGAVLLDRRGRPPARAAGHARLPLHLQPAAPEGVVDRRLARLVLEGVRKGEPARRSSRQRTTQRLRLGS